eukprot:TRINITY_DN3866_c0_g4_i1.p1 TRINITY_DN3866_c0_g4~~TRINITY_DN3866_c0_g4_i1.p1  ORF type:complete len:632 (-),score=82.18 TRINITY_DN3866_c0_g4_i1:442-2337(-)
MLMSSKSELQHWQNLSGLLPVRSSKPGNREKQVNRLIPPVAQQGLASYCPESKQNNNNLSAGLRASVAQLQESPSIEEKRASLIDSENNGLDFGFKRNMSERYEWGQELGRGGNGIVHVVRDKYTGEEWACKSIPKVLSGSTSEKKRAGHKEAVMREVEVLKQMRGCLNVAKFEDVFEDTDYVHVIMEWCKGGELVHAIGQRHYSERTVASYMRAVLRTLAQCHAKHILHRDIKPGNFMLLNNRQNSPLKAIDFGLASFYQSSDAPIDDLGLDGTPWFMAPEVLSSKVVPASDLWSAGVMAYQLLTGRMPFNDKRCPHRPSLTLIWRSILSDPIDFNKPYWHGISDDAKDFVRRLLNRDPKKRPTAKEALQHPFLKGQSNERGQGEPLSLAVVQRIQRFSQAGQFKRTVLEMIAHELLDDDGHQEDLCSLGQDARALVTSPDSPALQYIYEQMKFSSDMIDKQQMMEGLQKLGYRLEESEVARLMEQVDMGRTGHVNKDTFAASQIDWKHVQQSEADAFINKAQIVFQNIDADQDGFIAVDDIINCLREKLPLQEVREAVQVAMKESGLSTHAGGMAFEDFMQMLKVRSFDSLDIYDDRLSTNNSINMMLEKSFHGESSTHHHGHLGTVAE